MEVKQFRLDDILIVATTNAVENLHRQFRKVTKTRSAFPHDDALRKLL